MKMKRGRVLRLSQASLVTLLLPFLAALLIPVSPSSAYSGYSGETKERALPGINSEIDFISEPVRYMEQIQMDLHFGRIDEGIARAKKALVTFEERYGKDPNALLNDPMLKLNKAHQVKSILHTFLGMLYYRKSLMVDRGDRSSIYSPVLDKVRRGEKFTGKDLEKVADALEGSNLKRERTRYYEAARLEFQNAISADAGNPLPHFQFGKMYSASIAGKQSAEAEKEYFLAAKLLAGEGDRKGIERVIEAIASVNSASPYIKEIERMLSDR